MAAHDAANRGHAQSAAGILGRVKRIEHPGQRVVVHADAVVDHVDEHIAPGRDVVTERHLLQRRLIERLFAGLDGDNARVLNRLGGIDDQVHHDLSNLRGVGLHQRQRARAVVEQRAVPPH